MSANRAKKEVEVAEFKAKIEKNDVVLVTRNDGLTVKQVTTFRALLRKEGATLKVMKNTLARRAIEGTKFAGIAEFLSGPAGIIAGADPLAASRVAYNFAKDHEKLVILGGISADGKLDPAKIKQLALLPSLDALRGKIVGILYAPGAQLARLASAYATKDGAAAPSGDAPAAEATPAT